MGDPARRSAHGDGSAEWLIRRGYRELAGPVAAHPVTLLLDGPAFERWLAEAPPEERLVAYADKRAGQQLETMAERFASWARRYPVADDAKDPDADGATGRRRTAGTGEVARDEDATGAWTAGAARQVRTRAETLETEVCRLVGVDPGQVRRLRWTGRALAAARARR